MAAEKVRSFPQTPGVYLMKDAAGRVIYIGKAKNLRNRAGSYFLKAAGEDPRTAKLVLEIRDIDYIETKNEIDAILTEARLIKDILPKFNRELRDSKTFPYLEIHVREDFPRVCFTREPKGHGSKLYGPFPNPRQLRGAIQVLQKIFKFRTCTLEIDADDKRWQWFRPCLLHSIEQCTAPCNLRISKEEYRKGIRRLQQVLDGKKDALLKEMHKEMETAAKELRFEEAARLRDEIEMLESLDKRGVLETHVQPEVFPIDPKKGLAGLQKVLHLPSNRGSSKALTWPIRRAWKRWPRWCNLSTGCRSSPGTSGCGFIRQAAGTISPPSTKPCPGGSSICKGKTKPCPTCC